MAELDNRSRAENSLVGLLDATEASKVAKSKDLVKVRKDDGTYESLTQANSKAATEKGAIVSVQANGETFYYKRLLEEQPTAKNGSFKAIGFIQTDKDGKPLKDKDGQYHMVEALPGTTNVLDPTQNKALVDITGGKLGDQYEKVKGFNGNLKSAGEIYIKQKTGEEKPTITLTIQSHSIGATNAVIADKEAQKLGFNVINNVMDDPVMVPGFVNAAQKEKVLTEQEIKNIHEHTTSIRLQKDDKLSNTAMLEPIDKPESASKNITTILKGRNDNSEKFVHKDNELWGKNQVIIKIDKLIEPKGLLNPDPLHKHNNFATALSNGADLIPYVQAEKPMQTEKSPPPTAFNLPHFNAIATELAKAFGASDEMARQFAQEVFALVTNTMDLKGMGLADAGKVNPLTNYAGSSLTATSPTVQNQLKGKAI